MILPNQEINSIFHTLSDVEIISVYDILCARKRTYPKGACILSEGDTTANAGIVISGSVRIERIDYLANRCILAQIHEGGLFAESYTLLPNTPLMVDVIANTDCEILFLNLKNLESPPAQAASWYCRFLMNLLKLSNRKNLTLSIRNFHTAPKQVRGRILSYLQTQAKMYTSPSFDIPFNRQQLADYLNVDRSALSKELCKMRDEGLLTFHKHHFTLL